MAIDPNYVTIRGRLTADPVLRKTAKGASVVNLTIATNSMNRSKTGSWEDGPTTFWDCTAWSRMADNIAQTLTKGTKVIACVTPDPQSYEGKDGQTVHKLGWTITDIAASLSNATARIQPNPRNNQQTIQANSTYQSSSFAQPASGTDPWDATGQSTTI